MSKCTCAVTLNGPGVRLRGPGVLRQDSKQWVEITCNRKDEHPIGGSHWFISDGAQLTWRVDPGAVAMATP